MHSAPDNTSNAADDAPANETPDAARESGAGGLAPVIELVKGIAATNEGRTVLKAQIMAVTLILSSFFLFWNLGHYALWDDEAVTALAAKGIVRTGDTYVMIDGNLAAFGNGLELHNMRDRVTPALPVYATALSFVCFGENTWAARFPHALAGLLTAVLLLHWASKGGIRHLLLVSILLLGNVSFFLFARQCRYYAFVMFFTFLIFYLYWHWDGRTKKTVFLALAFLGLMFSYYITYVGVAAAIALDYILWKRKETPLKMSDWLIIIISQLAGVLAAYLFWNPYDTPHGNWERNNVLGMLKLFYMQIRDMNRNEFYSVFLMVIALGLGWYKKEKGVWRAALAILVIMAAVAGLSGQIARGMWVADVRYMSVAIALCLLIEARGIILLCGGRLLACVIVAFLAAFSNLSNGGVFFSEGVRSTAYLYAKELVNPPNSDPYKPVAKWINENIPLGALVLAVPNKDIYPLMFLANRVFYCWQLDDRSQEQFKHLPPVFFKGECVPDYMIVFGQAGPEASRLIARYCPPHVRFQQVEAPSIFGMPLYRPELFWRTFTPVKGFADNITVKIYKREGFDPAQIPRNPALRPPARPSPPAQGGPGQKKAGQ